MNKKNCEGFDVIGISARVRNDDPPSIAVLWSRFYESALRERLSCVTDGNVYCIYHDFESDHTAPFSMTIGYRVPDGAACPEGLTSVAIPPQTVAVFEAVGAQPDSLISQWQSIWRGGLNRAFVADFDTYDAENHERVTVSVGLKPL